MRQVTYTKTLAKYDELTEKQKAKVLDKLYDINRRCNWYHLSEAEFKTKLTKLGFYNIEVEFTGFSSQGDGACFTASHKRGIVYKGQFHRYSHSNTMSCDESEVLLAVAKRLADRFYKSLEKEYEYLGSKQAIEETILANDYEFNTETLEIE